MRKGRPLPARRRRSHPRYKASLSNALYWDEMPRNLSQRRNIVKRRIIKFLAALKKIRRYPEVLAALAASLEGWLHARCSQPSFETPRKRAAPQDDGGGVAPCEDQAAHAASGAQ